MILFLGVYVRVVDLQVKIGVITIHISDDRESLCVRALDIDHVMMKSGVRAKV